MKKRNRIFKQGLFIFWLMAIAALAFGAGEKERMAQRVSQIDQLKTAGVIGEMANGLLGFVKGKSAEAEALVDAENADRKTVYEAIARKQGVSTESVAKARAATLSERAVSGVWLQDASGKWYQKK